MSVATVDHPILLVVVAALCSPMLVVTARWFFDDLETFLEEFGCRACDDIWWRLTRTSQPSAFIWVKIAGFAGTYAIVVGAIYLILGRMLD
ncbi:MAG TPA: hypothetical protein VLT89_10655 [Usitatibacter sp.]|nr:hypothetical protein [Usitatibacter sp.]